jgi:hypothetical protein
MQSIEIAKPPSGSPNMIGQAIPILDWRSPCPCGHRVGCLGHRSRAWLGSAHRCRNRARDRIGGTLSDDVRVRFVHDGQKSSVLFEPAQAGRRGTAYAGRPVRHALTRNIQSCSLAP